MWLWNQLPDRGRRRSGLVLPLTIRVLCFGPLRDLAGRGEFKLHLETPTVEAAWASLVAQAPAASASRQGLRVAVNRAYVPWGSAVAADDEVAFIPPVAGG